MGSEKEGSTQSVDTRVKRPETRHIFKDYVPILTPLAAFILSWIAFHYTNEFNQRASVDASSRTLADLISLFGQKAGDVKDDAGKQHEGHVKQRVQNADDVENEHKAHAIAAMKIAAYGDRALLAVKMAFGSDDPELREGGKLVAEEMYLVETVERGRLTNEILGYYDNSVLRLGAQEWLIRMESRLSTEDSKLALDKLKQVFGSSAENCLSQDEEVAERAASFLPNGHLAETKDFLLGMIKNCIVPNQTSRFERVRNNAMNTLGSIAQCLLPTERTALTAEIERLKVNVSSKVSADTLARIEAAKGDHGSC